VRAHTIQIKRARRHRQALTGAEVGLWVRLKGRKLEGYHFRRQHPVGPFILDFYCTEAKLAIELDGYTHEVGDAPAYDARRDAWLLARGIETLRIGPEFSKSPDAVADFVLMEVRRRAPSVTS